MTDERHGGDVWQEMLDSFDNKISDPIQPEEYTVIGKRGVRRTDGVEKAGGSARYTIDVQLPGMLFARFLTSPILTLRSRAWTPARPRRSQVCAASCATTIPIWSRALP